MATPDAPQNTLIDALARACQQFNIRIATAESCTGGGIGAALTALPGSSSWYEGGVISYSNRLKETLLSVPTELLQQYGAVSEPVALAMLEGVLRATNAQVAVSVTGIAGPDGGSADKPVGTVCFAVGSLDVNQVHSCHFAGDREAVRRQSVAFAIEKLYQVVLARVSVKQK